MHYLFIGHGAARNRLGPIAEALRKTGAVISQYYDADLDHLNAKRGLPNADFMFIGLSREGRHEKTPAHEVEEDIVRRATDLYPPLPCCIICDEDGYLSAPYATKLGPKVKFIVMHERDPNYNMAEFCELTMFIPDVIADAGQIAQTALQVLRNRPRISFVGLGNPAALQR